MYNRTAAAALSALSALLQGVLASTIMIGMAALFLTVLTLLAFANVLVHGLGL